MPAILEVENLKKYFKTAKGTLHAVDGITFMLEKGKTLGVVGESGCGKSTLGRTIIHLLDSTDGKMIFDGNNVTKLKGHELKAYREQVQIIFQDPFSSLNPRLTVSETIMEPLLLKGGLDRRQVMERTAHLMDRVGLAARFANTYPHEMDGGRRQRIGIARALALNPQFIVCDEPVSALDVSIQAQVLNLMLDLQEENGLTYLFITHDLSVVKYISDEIMVMYLGQMVEKAESDSLFSTPLHPYTKALLSAIPVAEVPYRKKRILLSGEITSPINPKPGCRFAARCPHVSEECSKPQTAKEVLPGHFTACCKVQELNQL